MKNAYLGFLMSLQYKFMSKKPCICKEPGGGGIYPLPVSPLRFQTLVGIRLIIFDIFKWVD